VRDILLLLLVFAAVQWWQARDLAAGPAPPLVGLLLDGSPYQLDPAGGPILVHFWATWCPVCRLEEDSIARIAADLPTITVATTSGTSDEVAAYLAEQGLTMPVLLDEDGELARRWGVNGVPATFVIDREGRIRHAGKGYSTEIGLRLRMWLSG
jgi:thiol-disulfide isomerase/thioredoxin